MAVVSQTSLPVPKHPCPWTTKYIFREQADYNQDMLTGLAILQWVSDSQLSELLQVVPPCKMLGPEEILELKWRNK